MMNHFLIFFVCILFNKSFSQSQPFHYKPLPLIIDLGDVYQNEQLEYRFEYNLFYKNFAEMLSNENGITIQEEIKTELYNLTYKNTLILVEFHSDKLKSKSKSNSRQFNEKLVFKYKRHCDNYIYRINVTLKYNYHNFKRPKSEYKLYKNEDIEYRFNKCWNFTKQNTILNFSLCQRIVNPVRPDSFLPFETMITIDNIYKGEKCEIILNQDYIKKLILAETGDYLASNDYESKNKIKCYSNDYYIRMNLNSIYLSKGLHTDTLLFYYKRYYIHRDTNKYEFKILVQYNLIDQNRLSTKRIFSNISKDSFDFEYKILNNSSEMVIIKKDISKEYPQECIINQFGAFTQKLTLPRTYTRQVEELIQSHKYIVKSKNISFEGELSPILEASIIENDNNLNKTKKEIIKPLDLEKLDTQSFYPLFNNCYNSFHFIGKYTFESSSKYELQFSENIKFNQGRIDVEIAYGINSTKAKIVDKISKQVLKEFNIKIIDELYISYKSNFYNQDFKPNEEIIYGENKYFQMVYDLPNYAKPKYGGRVRGHGFIRHYGYDTIKKNWLDFRGYDTWYDCGDRNNSNIMEFPGLNKFCFDDNNLRSLNRRELDNNEVKVQLSPYSPYCILIYNQVKP
jgi:hypothetical protein